MQIVHINYSDKTGGAAIAAFRHNALNADRERQTE